MPDFSQELNDVMKNVTDHLNLVDQETKLLNNAMRGVVKNVDDLDKITKQQRLTADDWDNAINELVSTQEKSNNNFDKLQKDLETKKKQETKDFEKLIANQFKVSKKKEKDEKSIGKKISELGKKKEKQLQGEFNFSRKQQKLIDRRTKEIDKNFKLEMSQAKKELKHNQNTLKEGIAELKERKKIAKSSENATQRLLDPFKNLAERIPMVGKMLSKGIGELAPMMTKKFEKIISSDLFGKISGKMGFGGMAKGGSSNLLKLGVWGAIAAAILVIIKLFMKAETRMAGLSKATGLTRKQFRPLINDTAKFERGLIRVGAAQAEIDASMVALISKFGDIRQVTGQMVDTTTKWSLAFGIGVDEAAQMVEVLTRSMGMTNAELKDFEANVAANASRHGVSLGIVMRDITKDANLLALYSGSTGDKLAEAALQARKIGVSLEESVGLTNSLLDYETAMEKARLMNERLGADINANTLYDLAMNGKTLEINKLIGNAMAKNSKWDKMRYGERQDFIKKMGISADFAKKLNQAAKDGWIQWDKNDKKMKHMQELLDDNRTTWGKIWHSIKSVGLPLLNQIGLWLTDKINPWADKIREKIHEWFPEGQASGVDAISDRLSALWINIKTGLADALCYALDAAAKRNWFLGWLLGADDTRPPNNSTGQTIEDNGNGNGIGITKTAIDRTATGMDYKTASPDQSREMDKLFPPPPRSDITVPSDGSRPTVNITVPPDEHIPDEPSSKPGGAGKMSPEQWAKVIKGWQIEFDVDSLFEQDTSFGDNIREKFKKKEEQRIRQAAEEEEQRIRQTGSMYNDNRSTWAKKLGIDPRGYDNLEKKLMENDFFVKFSEAIETLKKSNTKPKFRGGLITKPTKAIIGEAGPELVLPLNGRKMDGNPGSGPLKFARGGFVIPLNMRGGAAAAAGVASDVGTTSAAGDPVTRRARQQAMMTAANQYREELKKDERKVWQREQENSEKFARGVKEFRSGTQGFIGGVGDYIKSINSNDTINLLANVLDEHFKGAGGAFGQGANAYQAYKKGGFRGLAGNVFGEGGILGEGGAFGDTAIAKNFGGMGRAYARGGWQGALAQSVGSEGVINRFARSEDKGGFLRRLVSNDRSPASATDYEEYLRDSDVTVPSDGSRPTVNITVPPDEDMPDDPWADIPELVQVPSIDHLPEIVHEEEIVPKWTPEMEAEFAAMNKPTVDIPSIDHLPKIAHEEEILPKWTPEMEAEFAGYELNKPSVSDMANLPLDESMPEFRSSLDTMVADVPGVDTDGDGVPDAMEADATGQARPAGFREALKEKADNFKKSITGAFAEGGALGGVGGMFREGGALGGVGNLFKKGGISKMLGNTGIGKMMGKWAGKFTDPVGMAINAIPGIGPMINTFRSIPVVGDMLDKLGAKVLGKIPGMKKVMGVAGQAMGLLKGGAMGLAKKIPGVGKMFGAAGKAMGKLKGMGKMLGLGAASKAIGKVLSFGKGAKIESAWHPAILEQLYASGGKPGDKIPKDEIKALNMQIFGKEKAPGTKDGFSFYDMKGAEEKADRRRSPAESLQKSQEIMASRGSGGNSNASSSFQAKFGGGGISGMMERAKEFAETPGAVVTSARAFSGGGVAATPQQSSSFNSTTNTQGDGALLGEIRQLRTAINGLENRPVEVHMDGRKVSDVVAENFEEMSRQ